MPKIKLKSSECGNYQFYSLENLVALWCLYFYNHITVLVLFDAKDAFDKIPALNILKRDNFKIYMLGSNSEFGFIVFESPEKARDFVYGFEYKHDIRWSIYHQGKLHVKSK